jgi:hypothetical protein
MKVEYKLNSENAAFWRFECPTGEAIPKDWKLAEMPCQTIVEAIGVVKDSVLVKYKHEVSATVAARSLKAVSRHVGFNNPLGTCIPLDRVHLQCWGFHWSDEKVQEVAEPFLDLLSGESPETVVAACREQAEVFANEKEKAQKRADELRAAGRLEEARVLDEDAQRYAQQMDVIYTQLGLLAPGGLLMLEAPANSESSSCTELSAAAGTLDERLAAAEDCEESMKKKVEELGKKDLIQWIYGEPDTLIVNVKPKMSVSRRLEYIRSKNPDPTPLEFAKLFMDLNLLERFLEPGKNAFAKCKESNKKFMDSFNFDALPEKVRNEYKAICYESLSCKVCGKPMVKDKDKLHCSDKCADNACECCNGPLELKVESHKVFDQVRCTHIQNLEDFLRLKGAEAPQDEQYHPECEDKLGSCSACKECQEKRHEWSLRYQQWSNLAREPESFWAEKQQQLKELLERPEMTTIVTRKRVCASGCTGDQRAEKRVTPEQRGVKRHFEQWDAMESSLKKQCVSAEPQA